MTKAQVGIYRINTEDDAETSQIDVVMHLGVFMKAKGGYPTYRDVADFTKALEEFVEQYNKPDRDYSLLKEALHELNNKPCEHKHTSYIEAVEGHPRKKYCVDCGAEMSFGKCNHQLNELEGFYQCNKCDLTFIKA